MSDFPLKDVNILDMTRILAGGMLSTVLADFGANVVKVERPGTGDPLRAWSPEGSQIWWKVYARNKESLSLDLSGEPGRNILIRLIPRFDVLVENFLPGKLESWGLGPKDLMDINPDLIYVRVTGWGQTGTYKHRPGFGTLVEAMSGFAYMTGHENGPPTLPPFPLADNVTALYGAISVMIALRARDKGMSRGQVIDLSICEPLISILGPLAAEFEKFGIIRHRCGNLAPTNAPRNTYRCMDDRWVALSAATQETFERLATVLGVEQIIKDPRFINNALRLRNVAELDEIIQQRIGSYKQREILDIFYSQGVTAAPIYDTQELLADTHIISRDVFLDIPDSDLGSLKMHNVIPRLSETPGAIRNSGPNLGADNEKVLRKYGFSEYEIKRAQEAGLLDKI